MQICARGWSATPAVASRSSVIWTRSRARCSPHSIETRGAPIAHPCPAATPRVLLMLVRLRTHLLQLLAPFHAGDEVVPGARLVGVLLEIGLGWRFRTEDGDLNVEVALAADAERFAARTARPALSYRAPTLG